MSQPYKPHPYQKRAIRFLLEHGAAGLWMDPGLGKTSTTYAALLILMREAMVKRTLVIAPLRPAWSVWPAEAQKWDEFSGIRVSVLHGPDKDAKLRAEADVDVINPEGLPWLFEAVKKLKRWPWDMLVVDESTKFKHPQTQRFKTLKPHIAKFRRRVILTGTPAPNGLMDLFGQVYILDCGHSLGAYITHYRNTYFDATGYGGYTWVPKAGADDAIYQRLRPLVLRMAATDYLKMPPLVTNTVRVELPPKARDAYDEMEEELIAAWEDHTITAANAASASGKCRQIANGGVYYEEMSGALSTRKWTNIHDAKTEAVADLVEELGGKPCLVAYEYQHDLERLRKVFPKAPWMGGGVTPKRQREVELAWNAGRLPVVLAQPQSVAHGLNLQGVGAAVILHSLNPDLELYDQFVRRVWRQGQKERVVVHHVVATNTVDEATLRLLARKARVQGALLDALGGYLRNRGKR